MKSNEEIFNDALFNGTRYNKTFYSTVEGTGPDSKIGKLRDTEAECVQDFLDKGYRPEQLQHATFGLGIAFWKC